MGGKVVKAGIGFRVLLKSVGPIKRYLVLSQLNHSQLCGELLSLRIFNAFSMVTIKDFSTLNQDNCADFLISDLCVPRAEDTERMLNKYTFVIDLAQDVNKLWSNMKPDNQRVCKKAVANGMLIECDLQPKDSILTLFFDRYKKMASEHSLAIPSKEVIVKMFEDGCLRMFYAKTENVIHSMILVYSAASTSFFLYGVPGDKKNDGSGQFVQCKAIEYLTLAGQRWYDLGGVQDVNGTSGIYRFKMSLGGELIDLGTEYYYCPSALSFAKRVYKKLHMML